MTLFIDLLISVENDRFYKPGLILVLSYDYRILKFLLNVNLDFFLYIYYSFSI